MICPKCQADNVAGHDFCTQCGHRLAATGKLSPNQTLGDRYLIVKTVDAGGMGAVYQARDTRLNNMLVAVKEMSTKAVGEGNLEQAVVAFQNEAAILSELRHPNLPRISDFFSTAEDRWYLVMDYVEGENLADLAKRRGRIPEAEVVQWTRQLCDILDYLHNNQPPIIFRDLKPSNIMLTPDGTIKLIDFGIARHFRAGSAADTMQYGSIGFAPPEQYGERQTDVRADIYALAATLHFLLTGQDPGKTPFSFDLPSKFAHVSPGFEKAIMQALQYNIEDRPKSMKAFAAMVESAAPGNAVTTDISKGADETKTLMMGASPTGVKNVPPKPGPPVQTPPPKKKGKWKLALVLVVLLVVGGAAAYQFYLKDRLPGSTPVAKSDVMQGGIAEQLFSPYEKEPNNTVQEAQGLQVNQALTGNLQAESDTDYYKFTLKDAGKVALNLKHDQASNGGWAVALLDMSNNRLTDMVSHADRLNVTSNNLRLSPGTYYVQVKSYGYSNLDYKLQINYSNEDKNFEKEPNNNIQSAHSIEVGQVYTGNIQTDGDLDYYEFKLASPGKVDVNFKHAQAENGGWEIAVLDAENNGITSFVSHDNTLNANSIHMRLPAGSYLVRVKSYGFTNMDYSFTVNYTAEADGYEKEWNDRIQNSQVIKVNQAYVGNLQRDDDNDYYQIQINTPGSLAVNFQHAQADNGGWRIRLLDANNKQLAESVSHSNELNIDSTSLRLPAGNYLIQVSTYGFNDADYKMTVNYKAE